MPLLSCPRGKNAVLHVGKVIWNQRSVCKCTSNLTDKILIWRKKTYYFCFPDPLNKTSISCFSYTHVWTIVKTNRKHASLSWYWKLFRITGPSCSSIFFSVALAISWSFWITFPRSWKGPGKARADDNHMAGWLLGALVVGYPTLQELCLFMSSMWKIVCQGPMMSNNMKMEVSKNRVFPPKMNGENNGKPLFKWMIWGVPNFWKHPNITAYIWMIQQNNMP